MREIKYQVFIPIIEKVHQVASITFKGEDQVSVTIEGGDGAIFHLHKDFLRQFTGLKDKNGNEIYEGDILAGLNDMGLKILSVVEWSPFGDGMPEFNVESPFIDIRSGKYPVVGNIYETPELLD